MNSMSGQRDVVRLLLTIQMWSPRLVLQLCVYLCAADLPAMVTTDQSSGQKGSPSQTLSFIRVAAITVSLPSNRTLTKQCVACLIPGLSGIDSRICCTTKMLTTERAKGHVHDFISTQGHSLGKS